MRFIRRIAIRGDIDMKLVRFSSSPTRLHVIFGRLKLIKGTKVNESSSFTTLLSSFSRLFNFSKLLFYLRFLPIMHPFNLVMAMFAATALATPTPTYLTKRQILTGAIGGGFCNNAGQGADCCGSCQFASGHDNMSVTYPGGFILFVVNF